MNMADLNGGLKVFIVGVSVVKIVIKVILSTLLVSNSVLSVTKKTIGIFAFWGKRIIESSIKCSKLAIFLFE